MAVSILCANYNPAIYNGLGECVEVDKQIEEEDIQQFGAIILKHGHEKTCFAMKSHRHHELGPEEAMLEHVEADGFSVVKPASLEQIGKSEAKPNVFAVGRVAGEDGHRWYPVNYAISANCKDANASLRDPLGDEAFLAECADWLANKGMDDKLMLGLFHQGFDPASGQLFLEENFEEGKISKFGPLPDGIASEGSIVTRYHFQPGHDVNGKWVAQMTGFTKCTY